MATNPPITNLISGLSRGLFNRPAEDLALFKAHAYRLDHNTLSTEHALMRAALMRVLEEETDPVKRQRLAGLFLLLQGDPR